MMIFGISVGAAVIWLAAAIVLFIIEAATVGLTTIWFAIGALAAFVLALFDIPVAVQIVVFLVVSVCLLVFTRRIFVEKLHAGSEKNQYRCADRAYSHGGGGYSADAGGTG